MDYFNYQQDQLYAENVAVADIVKQFGSPCFIYSRATLERHWRVFNQALGQQPHLICYAVKACPNLAVLNLFARLGSGFDVVSVGELERVLAAKGDPRKVVFSGVGKQIHELQRALDVGILCFNVESAAELDRLQQVASTMNKVAPVSLRINPDIDPKTHPYISTGLKENKFGIDIKSAKSLYKIAKNMPNIAVNGIDCHIGSQLTEVTPFLAALDRLLILISELRQEGVAIEHINLGGGLGVRYRDEEPPHPEQHAKFLLEKLSDHPTLEVILEPGRAIAANAGILVTRVEYLKTTQDKHFAIVDAGMNDLLRPALYQAWQEIIPVTPHPDLTPHLYDIVGPVCETGDFLGKQRHMAIKENDLLAVRGAGAYAFSMSSQYNSRPRAPEIMVDNHEVHLVRPRETLADLFATEKLLTE